MAPHPKTLALGLYKAIPKKILIQNESASYLNPFNSHYFEFFECIHR